MAETDSGGRLPPVTRLETMESWRAGVLRGILSVAAIAAPVLAVAALALRSASYPWPRLLVLGAVAVSFSVLRFSPGLSAPVRARTTVAVCLLGGVTSLMTFGFTSGSGIALAGAGVVAAVLLGRSAGLLVIGLAVLAYVVVGLLNTHGVLVVDRAELDPALMTNWARIALAFLGLSALLITAIDYIIRHVEHSSRAANEALSNQRLAYERLALLHERLDAAKEEERRYVASELHDELGQLLTVIKLRLQMGASLPAGGTLELVDQAIDRVRKISRDLRPPLLDEVGLMPALRAHVEAQSALSGVPIELAADEAAAERLPPPLEITCFRIVQESLTNALRHAAPSLIQVRAVRESSAVALEITDDGRGFDTAALAQTSDRHLGIIGMQERVRARGGSFRISSTPGAGTRVKVELPTAG
ncbi:MAG TPA: sensor histidine kinase [Polyangia bacterium]|nr:sensor histidine kinase [Polyangia bacterium]